MSYNAKVFNVMIASPNDVPNERNIIRDVVYEWNIVHSIQRNIVLLPIGWETHSTPEMGEHPQKIIDKQILDKGDLLVGVFWTRIGTSTGEYASGTVEEIEKHIKSEKPTMLYFSNQPVLPDSVDSEQYKKLKDFKESCRTRGLYETYDSYSDFKDKFYRQLQLKINGDAYFRVAEEKVEAPLILDSSTYMTPNLSREAHLLLKEASLDRQGNILHLRTFGGTSIQTNGKNLITEQTPRDIAKWEAALDELANAELIIDRGYKGEAFAVTALGYKVADTI
jgi:hypothetical protein